MDEGRNCHIGKRVSFLWVDHLDPSDGIGFSHGATKEINPKVSRFVNLAEIASGEEYDPSYDIPVRTENWINDKEFRDDIDVLKAKNIGVIDAFELRLNDISGWVTFNSNRVHGSPQEINNIEYLKSPGVRTTCSDSVKNPLPNESTPTPNIYILSGHGGGCRVYGEVDDTGSYGVSEIHAFDLKPAPAIKILIIASCHNLSFGCSTRYQEMFKASSLFAILGYADTYGGGKHAAVVFEAFAVQLRKGVPVIDAWVSANELGVKQQGLYPWGAMYSSKDEKFTIYDCLKRDRIEGRIMHKSLRYPTPRLLEVPTTQATFISVLGSEATLLSDRSKLKQKLDSEIETTINGFNSTALTKGKALFWYIRRVGEKKFMPGEVLIFKFCVVRPNYSHQLSIAKLFKGGFKADPAKYKINYHESENNNILMLTVNESCTEIIIPAYPDPLIGQYLTDNSPPSGAGSMGTLLLYLAECKENAGQIVLSADSTPFPFDKMSEDSKIPSWWKTNPHVLDLVALGVSFWVSPDWNTE